MSVRSSKNSNHKKKHFRCCAYAYTTNHKLLPEWAVSTTRNDRRGSFILSGGRYILSRVKTKPGLHCRLLFLRYGLFAVGHSRGPTTTAASISHVLFASPPIVFIREEALVVKVQTRAWARVKVHLPVSAKGQGFRLSTLLFGLLE